MSTLNLPVQAAAGLCYLCIGLIAVCLTLMAHFVDSCIARIFPGRAESQLTGIQQATPEESEVPCSAALALCSGPAGRAVRAGHGMIGACCGICLGLYRACFDTQIRKCSSECTPNEHHAAEQTGNSELPDS